MVINSKQQKREVGNASGGVGGRWMRSCPGEPGRHGGWGRRWERLAMR